MKRNILTVLALLLACLLVLTACGRGNQPGDKPDNPVGGGTGLPGGSGSGEQPGGSGSGEQPGGSGSTDPDGSGSGSVGGDSNEPERVFLGGVNGVEYWLAVYPADPGRNGAVSRELYAVKNAVADVICTTDGVLDYAKGSLEASGNNALYFTASENPEGNATLYCYDLYSQEVRQVLAAPCSNMVVFSGGDLGHYGWILQEDYIMPVDLKTQMADMTMAVSTMELSAFADVGGSFFANGQTASIKESEYGVLEITLTRGSTMTGYLYTCDTFTAVKLK